MRTLRIHARAVGFYRRHDLTICGIDGTTGEDDCVTCLRCLYWLGRYMPLTELYEHQKANLRAEYYGFV